MIIGADEVGYGSLAGPVAVGGVRAPQDWSIPGLNDSKKLTDKQRRIMKDKLYRLFDDGYISASISLIHNKDIDKLGITHCLKLCYSNVAKKLHTSGDKLIIDGNMNFDEYLGDIEYETVVKADTLIPTVMAASIIAKVCRDDFMIGIADQYPFYDWENNKGYGSPKHIAAIKKYGYSEVHRQSYRLK